jgi:hypothetical protein
MNMANTSEHGGEQANDQQGPKYYVSQPTNQMTLHKHKLHLKTMNSL